MGKVKVLLQKWNLLLKQIVDKMTNDMKEYKKFSYRRDSAHLRSLRL